MKIVYTRSSDGGTTIVHRLDENISLTGKDIPADASSVRVATDAEVNAANADRTFRNAWKNDLTVDMPKARDIHRNTLRRLRAPLLAALDIEYQKADEKGDIGAKMEIAAKKQALRDVTQAPEIEAAQTPAQLKAAIPAILK